MAKRLDEAGNVIVLGSVVFTRPKQVVKRMTDLVLQTIATPSNMKIHELEQMAKHKAVIDEKACSLVRGELYCGLGFIVLQTLGLMRLTFWELSWDVMEPICFFVTSLHFAAAYAFFLRTSTEPSFEGFYKQRLMVRQKKVMKLEGFDIDKYNELCKLAHNNFGGELAIQGCK